MSDLSALQRWCDGEAGWLRERLETFVRLESPTHDKAAVDRCGTAIAKTLSDIGARVTTFPNLERGEHLRAEIDGHGPQILILGHFDTVWDLGQIDRMPLREAGGRLYGPGIFDMKAGLTVALLAVRAIQASPMWAAPHVVVLFTSDEEVGSGTSRQLIEDEARRSRAVLVMEPSLPGGAAKTARKGCGEFELVVRGIAAHAGLDPGKGASAIHELAHQILAVSQFQDLARGMSVNAGVVSGGTRPNVTAAEARASIDVRASTLADAGQLEAMIRGLRAVTPNTTLHVTGGFDRPPLERSEAGTRLYHTARGVAHDLQRDLPEGAAGGGSDGNFTAALGVPTLDGLGPEGGGAHALDEHVVVADLPFRAALLAGLLGRLALHIDG
jgi:glutamate carboxypeptidase